MTAVAISAPVHEDFTRFWPVEFFFNDQVQDAKTIIWIMDQVGVLRSVFELNKWDCTQDKNSKSTMQSGDATIKLSYGKNRFFANSKQSAGTELYKENDNKVRAACIHLNNGTVMLFMRESKFLYCYHFCFEESDDWSIFTEDASAKDKEEKESAFKRKFNQQLKEMNANLKKKKEQSD